MKEVFGKQRNNKGITIITLVIIIVILLILARITIGTLTGENGLIQSARSAKEQTEIANEKEVIEQATVRAIAKERYGNITQENLQEALDKITGEGETEVADVGENFEICFVDSKRYYEVNRDGKVGDYQEIIEDKYPGDITRDKDGNALAGTLDKPYEIWCIEDLCEFSNMINTSGDWGINVKLMRDLNFKSKSSYVNGNIKTQGSMISCETKEELMKFLSSEGTGFIPIGIDGNYFGGNFYGNNKEIRNIYINVEGDAGLFGYLRSDLNGIIENLTITGDIISTEGNVGGIVARGATLGGSNNTNQITGCKNYANITSKLGVAGGILGIKYSGEMTLIINNCANFGRIEGATAGGGIIGDTWTNATVTNCYNIANIKGSSNAGGIVGYCENGGSKQIFNCYNLGNIKADKNAGGIVGQVDWIEIKFVNCYNAGSVEGTSKGGVAGYANISDALLTMKNCYFINNIIEKGIGNRNSNAIGCTEEELKGEDVVNIFNNYIEISEELDTTMWKKWKKQVSEFPSFQ